MRSRKIAALLSAALLLGTVAAIPVSAVETTTSAQNAIITSYGNHISKFENSGVVKMVINDTSDDANPRAIFDLGAVEKGTDVTVSVLFDAFSNPDLTVLGLYVAPENNSYDFDTLTESGTEYAALGHLKSTAGTVQSYPRSTVFTYDDTTKTAVSSVKEMTAAGELYLVAGVNKGTGTGDRIAKIKSFTVSTDTSNKEAKVERGGATAYYSTLADGLTDVAANGGALTILKDSTCSLSGRLVITQTDTSITAANGVDAVIEFPTNNLWNASTLIIQDSLTVTISGNIIIDRKGGNQTSPTVSVGNNSNVTLNGVTIKDNQWINGTTTTPNQCGALELKGGRLYLTDVTFEGNKIDLYTRNATGGTNSKLRLSGTTGTTNKIKLNPMDVTGSSASLTSNIIVVKETTDTNKLTLVDNKGDAITAYKLEASGNNLITRNLVSSDYFEFPYESGKESAKIKTVMLNITQGTTDGTATYTLDAPITLSGEANFYIQITNLPDNITINSITLN